MPTRTNVTCVWLAGVAVACGACGAPPPAMDSDTGHLTAMIAVREQAMIDKDVDAAMTQFADDATWINSQGYYFEGKDSILDFHRMLTRDDADYRYEAGQPRVRLLDANNAIVYYSWKMLWHPLSDPSRVTYEEVGLMTLTAQKRAGAWRWVAVTNQHTSDFYEAIEPVTVD